MLAPREFDDFVAQWRAREQRADFRCAQITWVLSEIHRDRSKQPRAFEVADFMADKPAPPNAPTTDEQKLAATRSFIEMLNAAFGGADTRPKQFTQLAGGAA